MKNSTHDSLTIVTWNLYHGHTDDLARVHVKDAFHQLISGWEWDVMVLQEVPPWWVSSLATAADAQAFSVRTSRNYCLPAQRGFERLFPAVIRSNGGANVILSRVPAHNHRVKRLCWRPERRYVHVVELSDYDVTIANVHNSCGNQHVAESELTIAADWIVTTSSSLSQIFVGDFNTPNHGVDGWNTIGGRGVDGMITKRWRGNPPEHLSRIVKGRTLSDHIPLRYHLRRIVSS